MKAKHTGVIKAVQWLSATIVRIDFATPQLVKHCAPGQFIFIKTTERYDPLLRRAMSIYAINARKNLASIIFKIHGIGTRLLAQKKVGEELDFLGPLGNRFVIPPRQDKIFLVAGGLGLAPLNFLLEEMLAKHKHPAKNIVLLLGTRHKNELVALKKSLYSATGKVKIIVSTDDGSQGFRGKVTELLDEQLTEVPEGARNVIVYACGPEMMLKQACRIVGQKKLFGQISVEIHMACATGICMGCVVRCKRPIQFSDRPEVGLANLSGAQSIKDPWWVDESISRPTTRTEATQEVYQRACCEGPVFSMQEIIWS